MISIRRAIRPMLVLPALLLLGQASGSAQVGCTETCGERLDRCVSKSLDPFPCYVAYYDCLKRKGF